MLRCDLLVGLIISRIDGSTSNNVWYVNVAMVEARAMGRVF